MISNSCDSFVKWLIPAHADEEQVLVHARACDIEPVVRAVLQKCDLAANVRRAANAALYRATLRLVLDAFDGLRVIVLKGVPLAQRLFDDPLMRETTDIDLWIAHEDLDRADAALKTLGYNPLPVVRAWATNQRLYLPQDKTRFAVEVHWALTQPPLRSPSFDEAWDQSCLCDDNALCWHELSDAHTWIALIYHAIQHVYAVKPWIDLAQAESRLACDDAMLKQYGLARINDVVRALFAPTDASHACATRLIAKAIRRGYAGILGDTARGHLIMGADSSLEAALGAASRAVSMFCVDGCTYRAYVLAFHVVLAADILGDKLRHGSADEHP